MYIIFSFILLCAGILCLANFRMLGHLAATFMAERFRERYGKYATDFGWDNPNTNRNKYFYRSIVLFVGAFLLMMAFNVFFGPITIVSGVVHFDRSEQVSE